MARDGEDFRSAAPCAGWGRTIHRAAPCVERIRITGTPRHKWDGKNSTAHPAIRGIGQAFNPLRHTPDGNAGTDRRGAALRSASHFAARAFRAYKRRRITPSPEPCRLSVSAKGRLPFETHRVQNPYRVKAIVVQCCPRPFPPCGFHLGSYRFVKRILILCNRISKPFQESRQKPTKPPALCPCSHARGVP